MHRPLFLVLPVLFIVTGVIAYRLGVSQSFPVQTNHANTASTTASAQDIISEGSCSYFQCLFNVSGQVVGYAELEGYYRPETVTDGGEENAYAGQTQTCDRFVVTKGSQPLISQFFSMIENGNTLNKTIGSNLVINLNLNDPNLDASLVKDIRSSTVQHPISLGVLQTPLEGKGAAPCTSLVRVVNGNRTLSQ